MLEIIKTDLNATWTVICWFIGFMVHQQFNAPYRLKKLLRLKLSKYYKLIDCYPCFSFWLALGITLNPITAITVFMIAQIIDRK